MPRHAWSALLFLTVVAPLRADPPLRAFACAWAWAMVDAGALSHGDFSSRAGCAFPGRAAAENVAWGQATAAAAVASWMASPPHRLNVMNPAYALAGAARAGKYWCLDLLG